MNATSDDPQPTGITFGFGVHGEIPPIDFPRCVHTRFLGARMMAGWRWHCEFGWFGDGSCIIASDQTDLRRFGMSRDFWMLIDNILAIG